MAALGQPFFLCKRIAKRTHACAKLHARRLCRFSQLSAAHAALKPVENFMFCFTCRCVILYPSKTCPNAEVIHETNSDDRHRRHHCLQQRRRGPCAGAHFRTASALCAGRVFILRGRLPAAVQPRQYQSLPAPLAWACKPAARELRQLRRLCHQPRHRHHGLYGGGAVVSGAGRKKAHYPHRRTEAHQLRLDRLQGQSHRRVHLRRV